MGGCPGCGDAGPVKYPLPPPPETMRLIAALERRGIDCARTRYVDRIPGLDSQWRSLTSTLLWDLTLKEHDDASAARRFVDRVLAKEGPAATVDGPPWLHQRGRLVVRDAGRNPLVSDALREVLGPAHRARPAPAAGWSRWFKRHSRTEADPEQATAATAGGAARERYAVMTGYLEDEPGIGADYFRFSPVDEDGACHGHETYAAAVSACRRFIDAELSRRHKPGMTAVELWDRCRWPQYGPFIVPENGPHPFIAADYAKERCLQRSFQDGR